MVVRKILNSSRWSLVLLFALVVLLAGCGDDEREPTLGEQVQLMLEEEGFIGSVSLSQNGAVLLEEGFGFANNEDGTLNTASTQFRIGSVTKPFTAIAILQLEEDGELQIEDQVSLYLPDYPNGDMITIKHLLEHSSGITNYTDLPGLVDLVQEPRTVDEVIDIFKDLPLEFEPGSTFAYSNSGFHLLGKIIEVVSGMTYQNYLAQNIFAPAGMTSSEYGANELGVNNRAFGYQNSSYEPAPELDMSIPYSAGAIASTVADLRRWSVAIDNNSLIGSSSTDKMFTPQNADYGLGWFLDDVPVVAQTHGGNIFGFTSLIVRDNTNDILCVLLSNIDSNPDVSRLAEEMHTMVMEGM